MRRLLPSVIVAVAFMFVCPTPSARAFWSEAEENTFESYAVGTTNLGSNWTTEEGSFLIQNYTAIYSGVGSQKSLNMTGPGYMMSNPNALNYHTLTEAQYHHNNETWRYSWWLRVHETDTNEQLTVEMAENLGLVTAQSPLAFFFTCGGTGIQVETTTISHYHLNTNIVADTWYAWYLEVNFANNSLGIAVQANVMPSSFTNWSTLNTGNSDRDIRQWAIYEQYQDEDTFTLDWFTATKWDPLEITSIPILSVEPLENYNYTIETNDPNAGFLLSTNAEWIAMLGHYVLGLPTDGDVGVYWVNVTASNVEGESTCQNWTITVGFDISHSFTPTLLISLIFGFGLLIVGIKERWLLLLAGPIWIFVGVGVLVTYGQIFMFAGLGLGLALLIWGAYDALN